MRGKPSPHHASEIGLFISQGELTFRTATVSGIRQREVGEERQTGRMVRSVSKERALQLPFVGVGGSRKPPPISYRSAPVGCGRARRGALMRQVRAIAYSTTLHDDIVL